ncbi:hypothetical protein BC939DRAFT_502000 [Gamsiella multidivaricata]|uniref:uncharacterized protein n=1 Tax=Gamsiella multidivaricata TaxID=101098 RepID=UPI0022209C5F|nr:uncharacterized protein BC939DRAFT_502000 [Gamsiella multidivaricata]KAI7826043.1 hypothetical protein BC939DRAFT_502000 [Gamsiella multidivaricata]
MEPDKKEDNQPEAAQEATETGSASTIPSEMSTMVSLLASSVQGMQGSLGNAYQSMANQLKQSMEMTQTMSSMMELFLVSSLSSSVERDDRTDKPLLVLTTENKSQFPIPAITGKIRIGKDNNEERKFEVSHNSRAILLSSNMSTIKRGRKESKAMPDTIYRQPHEPTSEEPPQPSSIPSSNILLPGMRYVDVFELNLENFDEWIILVEASFRSPGTGKQLFKKHECCVYLIDQCAIEWKSDEETTEPVSGHIVRMTTTSLRQILKVPATKGIKVGMGLSLSPLQGKHKIQGSVSAISEDNQETDLSLCCEETMDGASYILERICMELNALGEVQNHARQNISV